MFKSWFFSLILWGYFRLLWMTSKFEIIESESFKKDFAEKKPILLAHWHGDELALLKVVGPYKLSTMVSLSKDGELMTRLIRRLGGQSSRGSSSRGGVSAIRGLIRLIKNGNPASIAVDGPKGPIYKVKPGIFELAKLSKGKVYTMASVSSSSFVFEKAWNKTYLPKPFSHVIITVGEHCLELEQGQSPKDPKLAETLEFQLTDAKQKVSKLIANR